MAKQTAGFVDQHIEKVVLGACAAIFLGTAVYYFALDPYTVNEKNPQTLIATAREVAEDTQRKVREAKPYDPKTEEKGFKFSDQPLKELARWFGTAADGLIAIAGLDPKSPRTQAFPPPLLTVEGVAEEDKLTLAKLAAPSAPIVMSGHAYLDMPPTADFEMWLKTSGMSSGGESRERSWVSVAAQVNLAEQFKSFLAAGYPQGPSMSMPIVRLHLQRKLVGERGAEWEEVTPWTPYKRISMPEATFMPNGALDGTSSTGIGKFRDLVRAGQDQIARGKLPQKTEGTRGDDSSPPPLPYMLEPPGNDTQPSPGNPLPTRNTAAIDRAKLWLSGATKALAGQKPFVDKDPEMALMLARAASVTKGLTQADLDRAKKLVQDAEAAAKTAKRPVPANAPEEPEHLMPILAHDLDVTPGRTYVYRIRYEILNPLVGSANMRDPADARKMTLVSDWSPESRPVEVRSDLFYFLTKFDAKKQQAEFTVFKKVAGGEFVKKTFDVSPGDPVGVKERNGADFSTNKICVFIEPTGRAGNDTRVILADAVDGNLTERLLSRDSTDKAIPGLSTGKKKKVNSFKKKTKPNAAERIEL